MTITLPPELAAALTERASQQGVAPDFMALNVLRAYFLPPVPRDDWERRLRSIATDCGISLSNEAVSSEGIYE